MDQLLRKRTANGVIAVRAYLQEMFPNEIIELIEPPDGEDRNWTTRSFWLYFDGPQRLYFTLQFLEQDPVVISRSLHLWDLGQYIKSVGRVPIIVSIDGTKTLQTGQR